MIRHACAALALRLAAAPALAQMPEPVPQAQVPGLTMTPRIEGQTLYVDAVNDTGQRLYCVTDTTVVGMRGDVRTFLTLNCGGRVEPGVQPAICQRENIRLEGAEQAGPVKASCRLGTGAEDQKRPGERGHGHETPPPGFAR